MIKRITGIATALVVLVVVIVMTRTVYLSGWLLDVAVEALVFFAILEMILNTFPKGPSKITAAIASSKRVVQEAAIFLALRFLVGQLLGLPLVGTWEAFQEVHGVTGFWKAHEISAIFAFDISFAMTIWMFMNRKRSFLAWVTALLFFIFGVRATGNTIVGVVSATRTETKAIAEAATGESFNWSSTTARTELLRMTLTCGGGVRLLPYEPSQQTVLVLPKCNAGWYHVQRPQQAPTFYHLVTRGRVTIKGCNSNGCNEPFTQTAGVKSYGFYAGIPQDIWIMNEGDADAEVTVNLDKPVT